MRAGRRRPARARSGRRSRAVPCHGSRSGPAADVLLSLASADFGQGSGVQFLPVIDGVCGCRSVCPVDALGRGMARFQQRRDGRQRDAVQRVCVSALPEIGHNGMTLRRGRGRGALAGRGARGASPPLRCAVRQSFCEIRDRLIGDPDDASVRADDRVQVAAVDPRPDGGLRYLELCGYVCDRPVGPGRESAPLTSAPLLLTT